MKGKKLTILLATSMLFATGCNRNEGGTSVDETQTTVIYVQNYDCGYGRTYVSEVANKFMEAVKDVEYEPGKKGVYVDILNTQSNAYGELLLNSIDSTKQEVFFTQNLEPLTLKQSGKFMNLKDIVNVTSATEGYRFAEAESIMDRMMPDARGVMEDENGDVYQLPLFMHSYHFYYDEDLLKEKGLFIAEGSSDTELVLTNNMQELNAGPDGKHGTKDDGLPQTYAQFYLWCDEIAVVATPISYAGKNNIHMSFALFQWWADFEGATDFKMNWTFDGTQSDLVNEVNENGNVVSRYDAMEITPENGYMLTRQEGILQATKVAKTIADNRTEWLHGNAYGQAGHTQAQSDYILGKYVNDRVCMFVDGCFWEAEASSTFTQCESRGGGKMDRNFKVLPIPKATRSLVGTDAAPARSTVGVDMGLQLVVKKNIDSAKLKAIQDFLLYFNTSESCQIRNVESGCPVPFKYTLSEENEAKLSTYAKSLYDHYYNENTDLVYMADDNDMYLANSFELNHYNYGFNTIYDGDKVAFHTVNYFLEQKQLGKNVTAAQYFNGIYNNMTYKPNANANTKWQDMYKKISK